MPSKDTNRAGSEPMQPLLIEYLRREDDLPNRKAMNDNRRVKVKDSASYIAGKYKGVKRMYHKIFSHRLFPMRDSKKTIIGLMLIFSFFIHLVSIEYIYHLSENKDTNRQETSNKMSVKIKPTIDHKEEKKESKKPKVVKKPQPKIPTGTVRAVKKVKKQHKGISRKKLEALGKKYEGRVKEGRFPALIISYANPVSYVRQMYDLGAKTIIYDTSAREYYEINLFSGEVLPFSRNDFEGFSLFKRVMKDPQWNREKIRAATRIESLPQSLEILLLIPTTVETIWIGHQVNHFRKMNLGISSIDTVEALFKKGKMRIMRVHLKNGSSKEINDKIGA